MDYWTTMAKDFYETLGVDKKASQADIKKAYRKLAKKYHPDANPGDKAAEERFKEISQAYDVVGDPEKRKQYDQFQEASSHGFAGGFPGFEGFSRGGAGRPGGFAREDLGGFEGFGDILSSLFGGGGTARMRKGRGQPFAEAGEDIAREIEVPFEVAAKGGKARVWVQKEDPCPRCGGSGAKSADSIQTCSACGGSGHVSEGQGLFSFSRPCPRCYGRGRIIREACPECQGGGTKRQRKQIAVSIPAGVREGARIRLAGQGHPGRQGGPAGNLILTVKIAAHPHFRRNGYDIETDAWIDIATAALGGSVSVPTLDGGVTLKIPPGTKSGSRLRLKGRGVKHPGGGQGDEIVVIGIYPPKKLSERQKQLLEEFAKESGK